MKVLVTGVGGLLGYDVCKVLSVYGVEHRGRYFLYTRGYHFCCKKFGCLTHC